MTSLWIYFIVTGSIAMVKEVFLDLYQKKKKIIKRYGMKG